MEYQKCLNNDYRPAFENFKIFLQIRFSKQWLITMYDLYSFNVDSDAHLIDLEISSSSFKKDIFKFISVEMIL